MTANSVMKAMASSGEKMVTLAKAMYLYGVAANGKITAVGKGTC